MGTHLWAFCAQRNAKGDSGLNTAGLLFFGDQLEIKMNSSVEDWKFCILNLNWTWDMGRLSDLLKEMAELEFEPKWSGSSAHALNYYILCFALSCSLQRKDFLFLLSFFFFSFFFFDPAAKGLWLQNIDIFSTTMCVLVFISHFSQESLNGLNTLSPVICTPACTLK